jgi:hypothetical protein
MACLVQQFRKYSANETVTVVTVVINDLVRCFYPKKGRFSTGTFVLKNYIGLNWLYNILQMMPFPTG